MSKYGGSEKTTQAFVAAYNKAEALDSPNPSRYTLWHPPPLSEDESSPPTCPPPLFSGLFRA